MNQFIETLMSRRSVREYDSRPIPKETLQTIIDAGNAAATGNNAQGWRFVVVGNGAFREKLLSLALPRYRKWMEGAPASLAEKREAIDAAAADPIYYGAPAIVFVIGSGMTGDFDTPMVCGNMMAAARSLGIGSCWVYFGQLPLDDPGVRDMLEMQEGEKVFGPILLGYPENDFPESPQKKPAVIKWV